MAGQPDQAADDFLHDNRTKYLDDERLLYRLAPLHSSGRLAEAQALDAKLRKEHPELLTLPLRAPRLSDVPAYQSRLETALLAPLRLMGWAGDGR